MGKTKDFFSSLWQNIFSNAAWEYVVRPLLSLAVTFLIAKAEPLEWVKRMENVYQIPVFVVIGIGIWTVLSGVKQLFIKVFFRKPIASAPKKASGLRYSTKRLHSLTNDEKRILRCYIKNQTRTQYLSVYDGVANGLELENIIFRASAMGRLKEWAFNIQPWAWEYLNEHPDLLSLKKIEFVNLGDEQEDE